jgi:subtilisin
MTARQVLLSVSIAAAALLFVLPAGATAKREPQVRSGEYIVVYRSSVKSVNQETDKREKREGFKARFRYGHALKGFAAQLSDRQVEKLRSDPDVDFVAPARTVSASDSIPLRQGDSAPTGVRRIEAATQSAVRGPSTAKVAVIDTGIQLNHPDLNAVSGKNCVDTVAPIDPPNDNNGHGTHVAGTIAAQNDGSGVVGVAPGTKVYAVKVLGSNGSGSDPQVICGIDWVTATLTDSDPTNDIRVANMSLGGTGPKIESCATTHDTLHLAVCNSTAAGVTHVVAAGNNGWDFDSEQFLPDTPAAYPEVLTVTAIADSDGKPGGAGGPPACRPSEQDDVVADFSNFASTPAGEAHTVAGPGVCIRSTWLSGGYNTISGTSMASPHLAGAVALCLGEGGASGPCTGLSPAQIIQKMRGDARSHTEAQPGYGFSGDPVNDPVPGEYFGHLAWAGPPPVTYSEAVLGSSGLASYWRLGEASGTTAADQKGANPGTYLGGVTLGQPGALAGDDDTTASFDGQNDEMRASGAGLSLTSTATLEGWFYWQAGTALLRDDTSSGGWILAYDSGGKLAYRAGGTTFVTSRTAASLKGAWHHVVLTLAGGQTNFYVDGALVHTGTGAGSAASRQTWHVMRNGTLNYTTGRADEVAIYGSALSAGTVQQHYQGIGG